MDRDRIALFAVHLTEGVRRAASIARTLEGRVPNRPKRSEPTLVKQALTDADQQAQEALLEALYENFPDVCLEAEEDTESVSRFPTGRDPLVVIDPIDGTLHSYLEARGPYAVMIGLAIEQVFEAGLVSLPREGLLFGGTRGGGAWSARVGGPSRPVRACADGDRVLVSHSMPRPVVDVLERHGWEVIPACGGAIAVAPLIKGVRAGLRYAPNPGGVSIRGRIGCVISREAGALLETDGRRGFPEEVDVAAHTLRIATTEADLDLLAEAAADLA
jgi:hypothetical protein